MLSSIKSMSLYGLDGFLVEVQVDVSYGMPSWDIVGLPDTSIKEAKERVKAALRNSNIDLPSRKVVVNLAPANAKKEGPSFDLPIAIGIMRDLGILTCADIDEYVFLGELSLDGKLNKITGVLPMCIEAYNLGMKKVILPYENAIEAGVVKGLEIYPAKNLEEIILHLNGENIIEKYITNTGNLFHDNIEDKFDFLEVKGQENVRRALEIAAAGGHNCLLIGSPRFGKNDDGKKIAINTSRFIF